MNISYLIEELKAKNNLKEIFLVQIGSTWTIDSLYVFVQMPLAVFGFVINGISCRTFAKIKTRHHKKAYLNYLKIYTLATSFLCFLSMFKFLAFAPRYFELAFGSVASFYRCVLATWFSSSLYYFLNVLDCILLIERISNLSNNVCVQNFFNYDSIAISFVAFLICNVINLPTFFIVRGRSDTEYEQTLWPSNADKIYSFTYCNREPFFFTQSGRAIVVLVVLLRDLLTLASEIFLSFYSFALFRVYLREQNLKRIVQVRYVNGQTKSTSPNIQPINLAESSHLNQMILLESSSNPQLNQFRLESTLAKAESYSSKLTRMTIYLSMLSILSQILVAISYINVSLDLKSLSLSITTLVSSILVLLKCVFNFFLFYRFNKKFRKNLNCC